MLLEALHAIAHPSNEDSAMAQLDALISQPQLRQIMGGVSDTTIWRWRNCGMLPEPVAINGRNYFRESEVKALQERLFAKNRSDTRALSNH